MDRRRLHRTGARCGQPHLRLGQAGSEAEIFTHDAVSMICEASWGTLREIDRICQASLRRAADQGRTIIERSLVTELLQD